MPRRARKGHPVSVSVTEYARGAAGGLLFSLPLLYTMETWEAGSLASPLRLLTGLAGTFVLLLGYNRYAGLRQDASASEIAIDSVEELGLGLVGAACILAVLGRLTSDMSGGEIIGRIVMQGLVGSIGVSIGTAQLGGETRDQGSPGGTRVRGVWSHLTLGVCGAVIIAANVAPTEEVQVLGQELGIWHLAAIALLSFGIGATLMHYADFAGAQPASDTGTLAIMRNAVITYGVALTASAVLLWFFGRFDRMPAGLMAAQTIILGFPGALGASAGRLLLQK